MTLRAVRSHQLLVASAEPCPTLRAMHTPDPDDAFAWWAITAGRIRPRSFRISVSSAPIQTLNELCLRGEIDIAAVSSAAYPHFADRYAMLSPGASVGRGYGPALATRHLSSVDALPGKLVAVPGDLTTGALLLRLFYPHVRTVSLPFDQIAAAITRGEVRAGVLIHEELLNWEPNGLRRLVCLGAEWTRRTGLPIPVGLNVVRRDLGAEVVGEIAHLIRESMREGQRRPRDATSHSMNHSMQARHGIGEKFIRMFANEDTLDLAPDCLSALRRLWWMARAVGLIPCAPDVDPAR